VDNIEQEYNRLADKGVVFRNKPTPTHGGIAAVFEDTCGNLVQLFQLQQP